jgi:molecular chaperone GrpE
MTENEENLETAALPADTAPSALAEPTAEAAPEAQPAAPDWKAQFEDMNDRYLRMLAETENYKKRVARERSEERQYAAQETLLAFLPVADNLERALQASLKQGEAGQLTKGVELTLRQFEDILRRLGAEAIAVEPGKPFDPAEHQALFQEEHAEFEDGSVIEQLQKGYKLAGRVVRPAMVKVSRKP